MGVRGPAIADVTVPAATSGTFTAEVTLTARASRGLAPRARLPADPQRDGARRQPLGLGAAMSARVAASLAFAVAGAGAGGAHTRRPGPFTEEQAAAGRASYLANCAGCHLVDLRGANEARPLVGPDFMRTWSGRTAQELVAFLGVTMPPPPAAPGSLGPQTLRESRGVLAAGEWRRARRERADGRHERWRSAASRTARWPDAFRAALASAAPGRSPTGAAGRTGISVAGEVASFEPVTDAMLRACRPTTGS